MKIVRLFDFVKLYEEEEKEGMQTEEDSQTEEVAKHEHKHHKHEKEHKHKHKQEKEHKHKHEHKHEKKEKGKLEIEYDEHIWTSPKNAVLIIGEIANTLCEKDSTNCQSYKENSQNYISQIEELSSELSQIVASAERKQIVVADRFPFRYLTEEYGLDYTAAFPGCSDQSDASIATIAFLIKTVKNNKIPYIYHVELSNKKTAETVAEQTGAKMLLLHSWHNLSKQDFESGTTYLDFLKQNIENLKIGLLEK